ncbi:unnamed protein product [Orchesella dallaii]|uniref:Uncharacterized protein n=1 Tax=Orchesella dallaii TaxID=48710 RepID=A0ABP1S9M9_9HEXA
MWSSRSITTSFFLLIVLSSARGQAKNSEFKHELPEGVELVDPKSLGLSDDDLSKFLGNVKVLGGGQIGDTKTQILSVGFDGDENINFNDFDIPGLTDKNASSTLPEKDKEIADIAFKKFKEFFQDPKKAKQYDDGNNNKLPFSPNKNQNHAKHRLQVPQKHGQQQFHQNPQPQYHIPMIHKPYTTPRNEIRIPQQHQVHQPPHLNHRPQHQQVQQPPPHTNHQSPPQTNHQPPPQTHRQRQQHGQLNPPQIHRPQTQHPPPPPPNRQYVTPFTQSQNQQQAYHSQIKSQPTNLEFGARIPVSPNSQSRPQQLPQPTQQQQQYQHHQQTQEQYQFHRQLEQQHRLTINHQQHSVQHPPQQQPPVSHSPPQQQPPVSHSPPQQHYQPQPPPLSRTQPQPNFNVQPQIQHQQQQTPQEQGRVVRNQLLQVSSKKQNLDEPEFQPPPPYPSPTNHVPAHSHHQNKVQPPPRTAPPATSHVYIQHGAKPQSSTIQHTPFHPGFQPPTRFAKDFTPLPPLITTSRPRIEVTPSMPLIPLSTNENAIKDPTRTMQLRQYQRERAQASNTHQSRVVLPQPPTPTAPTTTPISITTSYPETERVQPQFSSSSYQPGSQQSNTHHHQQQRPFNHRHNNNNAINENEVFNNPSFKFNAQQQQHQLHLLQQQQQNSPPHHHHNHHQQQQQHQYHQQSQPQTQQPPAFYSQEHNRPPRQGPPPPNFQFHVQHDLGRPPRFHMHPDPKTLLNTIRRKRGYRRLSNLFRMFRWDRH